MRLTREKNYRKQIVDIILLWLFRYVLSVCCSVLGKIVGFHLHTVLLRNSLRVTYSKCCNRIYSRSQYFLQPVQIWIKWWRLKFSSSVVFMFNNEYCPTVGLQSLHCSVNGAAAPEHGNCVYQGQLSDPFDKLETTVEKHD